MKTKVISRVALLTRRLRFFILIFILGGTVGCDQASKHLARQHLTEQSSLNLPGGIGELCLTGNPGSFLSLGDSFPNSWRFALLIVVVGIFLLSLLIFLILNSQIHWLSFLGLAFICAGGISNLIDRIVWNGLVTDFIVLRAGKLHTGVFNPADTIIMIGMIVLFVGLFINTQEVQPRNK